MAIYYTRAVAVGGVLDSWRVNDCGVERLAEVDEGGELGV
jgi:hypothetical protein